MSLMNTSLPWETLILMLQVEGVESDKLDEFCDLFNLTNFY